MTSSLSSLIISQGPSRQGASLQGEGSVARLRDRRPLPPSGTGAGAPCLHGAAGPANARLTYRAVFPTICEISALLGPQSFQFQVHNRAFQTSHILSFSSRPHLPPVTVVSRCRTIFISSAPLLSSSQLSECNRPLLPHEGPQSPLPAWSAQPCRSWAPCPFLTQAGSVTQAEPSRALPQDFSSGCRELDPPFPLWLPAGRPVGAHGHVPCCLEKVCLQ